MVSPLTITTDKQVRFINHTNQSHIIQHPNNALASFAIDDAIAETVGKHLSPVTIRMWVHRPTIVLGIPDARLPYIEDGLAYLAEQKTKAVVRNSGGLAVMLDAGVLNMSMIIPNEKGLSINEGYDRMYQFIQQLFAPYTTKIKAYEIIGSYCPGDYDLSINGIKFAGISQRRVRNGVAVQIYLDIEGDSQARAQLVKDFYAHSKQGADTSYDYPDIVPTTMGSISELLDIPFTVNGVVKKIQTLLQQHYKLIDSAITPGEENIFGKRLHQMEQRNERLPSY